MDIIDVNFTRSIPAPLNGLANVLHRNAPIQVGLLLCHVVNDTRCLTSPLETSRRKKMESGLQAIAALNVLRNSPETPLEIRALLDDWLTSISDLTRQQYSSI